MRYTPMMILAQQTPAEHHVFAVVLAIIGFVVFYVVLLLFAVRIGRRRWATMERIASHLDGIEKQLTRIADAVERPSKGV